MPPRSRWDQDDSDDERPIYRGPRNYEGATSVIGDAWDDLVTSVKRAAEKIRDANDDGSDGPTLSERAKQSWEKAKVEWEKMNEQQKSTSGMPEGCFCDMRGWACPKHRGKEKWRQSHVVKIHEAYNGGDGGAAANGAASDAAAEDNTHLDALMAQLMTMGFEPERITQALTRHRDLESAIQFLLDSPEPPPPRVPSTDMLGAPPAAPAPPPPGAPAVGDLLGDLLDLSVAPPPPASGAAPSLQPPPGAPPAAAPPTPPAAQTAANSLDALLGTPQGPPPPAAAAPPSGGSGGGLSADVFAALAAPPVSVPAAVAAPLIPTPAAAPAAAPSPKPAAAAVLAAPPAAAAPAAALPAGWVSKVEPSNGKTYYFNSVTRRSQWERPTAPAAAAAASPATPPAAAAAAAPLPPGWSSGWSAQYNCVYYCNASLNVTQWQHPCATAAASAPGVV